LMRESNAALISTMRETNSILAEMRIAISELKESIHGQKR
jgi:hypothetical protein